MKKKIACMLSLVLALAFLVSACGTDPTTVDYNGYSYDDLYNVSAATIESMGAYSLEDAEETLADLQENSATYISSGYATEETMELTIDIYEAWIENTAELGDYTGYEDFSITKAGSTLTTDMTVLFTDGSANFQLVYNYNDMSYPTAVTINENQTLGQKMAKAGLNTVISISIVFAVLILISLIIYAFNIFPYLENRKKEKEQARKAAQAAAEGVPEAGAAEEQPAAVIEVQQETDDLELIAVIAAAIAADMGTTTEGFVVRSIRRR